MQDWYLDVVCGLGKWQAYIALDNNTPVAVWVIMHKSKWGVTYGVMPPMGMYQGLYMLSEDVDSTIVDKLSMAVKKDYHFVLQDIPMSQRLDIAASEKSTYIIPSITTVEEAFANLKPKCRRSIKKAGETLTISEKVDSQEAIDFFDKAFHHKGVTNPFPKPTFSQLIKECFRRNQAFILGAKDASGEWVAMGVFFYDYKVVYNIGGAQIGKDRGMYLILWDAIKKALVGGKSFDFEGSVIPGVAKFFEGFGGVKENYPVFSYSKYKIITYLAHRIFKIDNQ